MRLVSAKRGQGLLPQTLGRRIVARPQADAGQGRGEDLRSVDVIRVGDTRDDPLDQGQLVFRLLAARQQQSELVPARSGQHLVRAEFPGYPLGDPGQQLVADAVSVVRVDLAEFDDIEDGDRETLSLGGRSHQFGDRTVAEFAIGQPCQPIEVGALKQFVLESPLRVDIDGRADPPGATAERETGAFDQHRAPVR